MKLSIRKLLAISVGTVCALVILSAAPCVRAQQKEASAAEQLIGIWTLVSAKTEHDGKLTEPYGPNPKGLFIFDRSGRYAILQFRPDIPRFASNLRDRGTPEENRAVVTGSNCHFGTYTVDEKEGAFSIRPEAGTFPNWVGMEQKRSFAITNDELTISNKVSSSGGISKLILKRAR